MILIADSGSSKTDWRLFHPFNSKVLSFTSRGLNPYFVNAREISETIEQTIPKVHIDQISTVYFYGSGCGTNDSKKTVYSGFKNVFDHIDINIYSDLSAACRALFGNENGIACILGTGSNACLYRGGKIEKEAVSFGYILGDEGSGSHLGKLLLKGIFSNNAPAEISQAFHREFPIIELSYILEHLYRLPSPNKFLARFAPFIYKHRQHAYIKSMLEFAFDDFLNEFVIKIAEENDDRIGFLGSIAYFFEEEIKQACIKKGLYPTIFLKHPIDRLTIYHQQNN